MKYVPFAARWTANDSFQINFRNQELTVEGKQPRDMVVKIVDSLNDAYNKGVADVTKQTDPVIDAQAKRIGELESQLASAKLVVDNQREQIDNLKTNNFVMSGQLDKLQAAASKAPKAKPEEKFI